MTSQDPLPRLRRRYPEIERRAALSREELQRNYLARHRPVVISGTKGEGMAAWSPGTLRERYGETVIQTEGTEVYVGERAHAQMTLAGLLDRMQAGDATRRWKGLDFLSVVPGMRDALALHPPPSDALLPATAHAPRRALWLAPRGTMSSLHHDGNVDNFNCQVSGKKLFLLIPPGDRDRVYPYGSAQSPINPFAPGLDRFPRFQATGAVEATLSPGEILFLPKYWWHCVYAVETSVNLATWFHWRGELSPWRALRGGPFMARSCMALAAEMKRRRLYRLAAVTRTAWFQVYRRMVTSVPPDPRGELCDP